MEVVAKLIAGNADINLENEVSTSLHVSERFRLYQGLSKISSWNTRWRCKVPAIVSQSVALRKISCLPNEPWVHTQSKKYIGSALKNNHEKAQGSCALFPWSLAGLAIFNYISFPVCNFWLDWFDVTPYVYSQGSTGSRFFQPHQYFLWYCEWRRGKVIDSGSREIEGGEPGNWYRMQVHKLDVTDNVTRDCAAAESHIVLEENSHRRI